MRITSAFLEGLCETPQDVETIAISDKRIEYFAGCFRCMKNGGECIYDDDMRKILQKLLDSDLLIFNYPLYCYGMPAMMKAIIERTLPLSSMSMRKVGDRYEHVEQDYDATYSFLADNDIMNHYPYVFDEKRVKGWISKNEERYKKFGFGLWAVALKGGGEVIGDCGLTLQNINGKILPEIGYHISKKFQRKGYAKEAARAVRD